MKKKELQEAYDVLLESNEMLGIANTNLVSTIRDLEIKNKELEQRNSRLDTTVARLRSSHTDEDVRLLMRVIEKLLDSGNDY